MTKKHNLADSALMTQYQNLLKCMMLDDKTNTIKQVVSPCDQVQIIFIIFF